MSFVARRLDYGKEEVVLNIEEEEDSVFFFWNTSSSSCLYSLCGVTSMFESGKYEGVRFVCVCLSGLRPERIGNEGMSEEEQEERSFQAAMHLCRGKEKECERGMDHFHASYSEKKKAEDFFQIGSLPFCARVKKRVVTCRGRPESVF